MGFDSLTPENNGLKKAKHIMEKRRRARINASLAELKCLLPGSARQGAYSIKMEKADILERAVEHLKVLTTRCQSEDAEEVESLCGSYHNPRDRLLENYDKGYRECLDDVDTYLLRMRINDSQLRAQILGHLSSRKDRLKQSPGYSGKAGGSVKIKRCRVAPGDRARERGDVQRKKGYLDLLNHSPADSTTPEDADFAEDTEMDTEEARDLRKAKDDNKDSNNNSQEGNTGSSNNKNKPQISINPNNTKNDGSQFSLAEQMCLNCNTVTSDTTRQHAVHESLSLKVDQPIGAAANNINPLVHGATDTVYSPGGCTDKGVKAEHNQTQSAPPGIIIITNRQNPSTSARLTIPAHAPISSSRFSSGAPVLQNAGHMHKKETSSGRKTETCGDDGHNDETPTRRDMAHHEAAYEEHRDSERNSTSHRTTNTMCVSLPSLPASVSQQLSIVIPASLLSSGQLRPCLIPLDKPPQYQLTFANAQNEGRSSVPERKNGSSLTQKLDTMHTSLAGKSSLLVTQLCQPMQSLVTQGKLLTGSGSRDTKTLHETVNKSLTIRQTSNRSNSNTVAHWSANTEKSPGLVFENGTGANPGTQNGSNSASSVWRPW